MPEIKKILGNKKIQNYLEHALVMDRLSHVYIFNGAEGMGKKTFANFFAAKLLCAADTEKYTMFMKPCKECTSCVKAQTDNHPDIIWVEHEKASTLSIDEVRDQIINDINIAPYYGPYKIYIIKDAQLLNAHGQNALLKTIEEPPEYALIFILTDNAKALPETILSRSICLDMEPLPVETVVNELEDRNVPTVKAKQIAAFTKGNLGAAIEMAADEGLAEKRALLLKYLKNLEDADALQLYEFACSLGQRDGDKILAYMLFWFRDLLCVKSGKTDGLYFESEKAMFVKQAQQVSYEAVNNVIKAVFEAQERLEANVKSDAVFETLLLKVRQEIRG